MQPADKNHRRGHGAAKPPSLHPPLVTSTPAGPHVLTRGLPITTPFTPSIADHQPTRDIRSSPTPKAAYHDLHSDDITTLTYHPSNAHILLSGSTDGLVSIHDTSVADEDEMTVQTLNLGASVHRAGFLADALVCALSHDERFALYDVSEEHGSGDALCDFGDLREGLGCQYVADVVPKVDGSGAIVGTGSQE
jgi:WD40 repeat protein